MIYRLTERVTDPLKIMGMTADVDFPRHSDYTLTIEDGYRIERRTYDDMMYYVHFKSGRIVKICVYQREVPGND